MAMVKTGQAFDQAVVEVLDGAATCEQCGKPINLMESTNGVVECHSCGFKNKVKDME